MAESQRSDPATPADCHQAGRFVCLCRATDLVAQLALSLTHGHVIVDQQERITTGVKLMVIAARRIAN